MSEKVKIIRISTVPASLKTLLKGQLKTLNSHYDVIGVASPGPDLEIVEQQEGIRTIAVAMERRISPLKDIISLLRLIKVFKEEKPQIIHSITPKAGLLSMIAGKIAGVPIRIHTFTGLIFPTSKGLKKHILMATDRITCACATKIIPEGEGVKNDLINNNITKKPLRVLANGNVNGIDLEYFKPRNKEAKDKNENIFTFIFIGRIVADKGMHELCEAFQRLSTEQPHVRLLLVGDFEDTLDPLSTEDKKYLLSATNIEYAGYQTDVRPWFEKADALVFPSYREGFPNVVIQAGAMGLPSIVTDINGCNEIIIEGKNGTIIPPHDTDSLYKAMKRFVSDREFTSRLAENARELIATRYDRNLVWKALLQEYKSLLHND